MKHLSFHLGVSSLETGSVTIPQINTNLYIVLRISVFKIQKNLSTRTYANTRKALQYTSSVSTIILSGRTYSPDNIRHISDKFESQHSLSPAIWSNIVVGRESGYLKIIFTFLEVNMSNIL